MLPESSFCFISVFFSYRAEKNKNEKDTLLLSVVSVARRPVLGHNRKREKTRQEPDSQTWQRGDTLCSALIPPRPVSMSMTSFLLFPCRVFVLRAPEAASKWMHDNSRASKRRTTHHYYYYCSLLFKLSPGRIQFVIPSSPPSPAELELVFSIRI